MQLDTTSGRAGDGMPDEVLVALHAAEAALVTSPRPSPVHGTLAQWADVVAVAQRVVNMATGVQDEALVSLAAIESEVLDDGTVVQSHRAPGHVALDAPAIVSGALSVSSVHAENRVRAAVRLAADGPAGSSTATGLRPLHEAMVDGRLDSYRAGVLADELEAAPPEVAAAVVQALDGYVEHETGPQLRARCRRVLATISPDLVRQRATKAREQCGLRRWAEEPGVDKWEGTFPSEDAARAWAAIDARAQQLRADGTCPRIERARAQALIDLVTASATITTVLTLTVPANTANDGPAAPVEATDDVAGHRGAQRSGRRRESESLHTTDAGAAPVMSSGDLVEVTVSGIAQPVLVTRGFLDLVGRALTVRTVTQPCHPLSGALSGSAGSAAYRPRATTAATVRQRDGRCRFPGCHVNARFCDLDHVRPWPSGPTTPTNLICLCRRHHRIKQRHGWRVRLAIDGQCTWTDPTGRVRTTSAIDALHSLVLPAHVGTREHESDSGSATRYDLLGGGDLHSALEFTLEHHAAVITTADLTRAADLRSASLRAAGHRAPLTIDLRTHRPRADRFVLAQPWTRTPGHRTSRHGRRPEHGGECDEPPF